MATESAPAAPVVRAESETLTGNPRLGYIVGVSFSGSTLAAFALNSHPDILSIGEMGASQRWEGPSYGCSCGEPIGRCPFFLAVGDRMRAMGIDFVPGHMGLRIVLSANPRLNRWLAATLPSRALCRLRDALRRYLPSIRRREGEFLRRNETFIRAALEVDGGSVFVDATKHPSRVPFLQRAKVDLRVIHLVRDPRGYCLSARKVGQSAEQAARSWVRGQREVEIQLGRVPRGRWIRVRHEDLCADPGAFSELAQFLGAAPYRVPSSLDACAHHIIGNSMRKAPERRSRIQDTESWRSALGTEELQSIATIAGRTARRYGYDLEVQGQRF